MNLCSRVRVKATEKSMQVCRSFGTGTVPKTLAQSFRPLRAGKQTLQQGAQVQAGASDYDG